MQPVSSQTSPSEPTSPPGALSLTEWLWAAAASLGFLLLINWFLLRYDLEGGLSYGLPTIPPVVPWFMLFLLIVWTALAGRLSRRLAMSRRQMLLVFGFLAVAVPIASYNGVRALLPHLSILPYLAAPDNEFARIATHIPDRLMPKDQLLLIAAYEGAADGRIPWGSWLGPVTLWSLFLAALALSCLCWVCLLRHRWNAGEHLSYPMIELPREMVGLHRAGGRSVLQDPLLWVGFALASVLYIGSILKVFIPSLPAASLANDLSRFFTEEPLSFLLPMRFNVDPGAIGAAYLVPGDILFSIWTIFLAYKLVGMIGGMFGLRSARFPYFQEQSIGGYLAYGLLVIYLARDHLGRLFQTALGNRESEEAWPLSPAWAVWGFLLGTGFVVVWCIVNRFALQLALPYFAILLVYTVLQVRIRAETGIPLAWAYPYGTQKSIFDQVLGTKGIIALGGEQGLVMLSYYSWLARYNYLGEVAAYLADNVTLWQEAHAPRRAALGFTVAGVLLGIGLAFIIHLQAYYEVGAGLLQGGALSGGSQTQVAQWEYHGLSAQLLSPAPPDQGSIRSIILGAALTLGLAFLRKAYLRFPLHPLGFLMATCYGPNPYYWSSFMLAWVGKALVLRLGGAGLYRRALPFFLGLVLGAALTYNVIWTIVRALLPEGMVTTYI